MFFASPFFKNCCFIHRCEKEWKGNRCHKRAKPLQPPTSSFLQNGGSGRKKYLSIHFFDCFIVLISVFDFSDFADIWIGLGICFLLIKITAAALYFFKRKKVPEM